MFKTTKLIGEVQTDTFLLEVHECLSCGFHLGLDSTFFEQLGEDIDMPCPSCKTPLHIDGDLDNG